MKSLKYILPLLFFFIIMGFLWQGLRRGDPHTLSSALIGHPAPPFVASSLLNPKHSISNKDFIGHVSLLNVWATWCVTCHAEHPVLMDIAGLKEVKLYGLNYKDDDAAAKKWLDKYGNPYDGVINDTKGTLAIDFGVYGTPETFIIDQQGVIQYKHVGAVSPTVWKDELEPMVKALTKNQKPQLD